MAVGHVSTTNGTAGTTSGSVATAVVTAAIGDALIVVAGSDDRASAEALSATAVTDSAGNTWVRLLTQQDTNATAADLQALAIYGCTVTNTMTNATVTLTASASTVLIKDFTLYRFTGLSLTIRGLNSGLATGTIPTALSTSAPLQGDLVIGASVLEGPTSDTFTADTDTTNGSWSAVATDGTTGGTATSQISIRSQWKVVNAAGTQTYNGSNSINRSWARGILVLAPTPPPASSAAPPIYVNKTSHEASVGSGRIVAGQVDVVIKGPNFNRDLPPIVYNPGVYNTADEILGGNFHTLSQITGALVDMGFLIVATTTFGTFGNATSQSAIAACAAYARTNYGCSTKPFVLMGGSEGASDSLTYAYVNPAQVACVVGIIPVIDLVEMVEQNVLGLGSAVLSAWGVGALPLPAGADPNTTAHRTTLAQVPIQLWYSTNDEVSANITNFQQAVGCEVRSLGPLGHTAEAIAAVWPKDVAWFIRKRVGVPHHARVF